MIEDDETYLKSPTEKMDAYKAQFREFEDEFDSLNYLIALSGKLPSPNEGLLRDCYLVEGCQSKAWMRVRSGVSGVSVEMYSDTLLVRGMMFLICDIVNGSTREQAKSLKYEFFDECGLTSLISNERRSGLHSILNDLFQLLS